jgi:hypothetical protein
MTQVSTWFECKFDFSFPVELLPNLCAQLRGTPARLEEALRGHSHKILIRKPKEKWSAQGHAGHLLDLEPLWPARVGDYMEGRYRLTGADLTNRKTHEANHNARLLAEILAEFRAARERLLKRVDELDALPFARTIPHPRLKTPMRYGNWSQQNRRLSRLECETHFPLGETTMSALSFVRPECAR